MNNTPLTSPLRPASLILPATPSSNSLADIVLSPVHSTNEPGLPSPTLSTFEEAAALDDANATFLTLIAFQERRVVELREELARAESELDLLKQQWTRQQLKITRTDRQEHVRQNSLSKLEQQIMSGTTTLTPRQDDIIGAGRRLAEGVRDGFFSVMQDLKAVADERGQSTPQERGRSPAKRLQQPTGSEFVESRLSQSRNPSPAKRSERRESDGSNTTQETYSTNQTYDIPIVMY